MTELSIPFEEDTTPFKSSYNWNEFREFSPSGMVPCLIDGEQVVWDSLAITEYLAEKHSKVWPSEHSARIWARCATAEMHSGFFELRNQCPMNCGVRVKLNNINEGLQKDLNRIDELWNEGLTRFNGPFLAGDSFTAVDAFYAPVTFRIKTFGLVLSSRAMDYVENIQSLNSVKSWKQQALKESWIEPGHEEETLANGVIVEDLREHS